MLDAPRTVSRAGSLQRRGAGSLGLDGYLQEWSVIGRSGKTESSRNIQCSVHVSLQRRSHAMYDMYLPSASDSTHCTGIAVDFLLPRCSSSSPVALAKACSSGLAACLLSSMSPPPSSLRLRTRLPSRLVSSPPIYLPKPMRSLPARTRSRISRPASDNRIRVYQVVR